MDKRHADHDEDKSTDMPLSILKINSYDFIEPPQEYHDSPVEVAFKENDPFYSNQGNAGTCVRHSIAKAIHAEALDKGMFPMKKFQNPYKDPHFPHRSRAQHGSFGSMVGQLHGMEDRR